MLQIRSCVAPAVALLALPGSPYRRRAALVLGGAALALGGCGTFDLGGAGAPGDFERRLYVGAGALLSELEPDTDGDDLELDDTQGAGGSLALGYDLSERFSVEGHVATLGEATFDPAGDIAYQVGGLSALGYLLGGEDARELREGFSLFGRLGVGTMRNQADEVEFDRVNDVHLLAGLGGEYGLGNGLALRAELLSHERDAKYAQLGVLYRFGDVRRRARARARPPAGPPPAAAPAPAPAPAPSPVTTDDVRATPVPVPPTAPAATALDGDADGVPDTSDRCPDTLPGLPVGEGGCDRLGGVIDGVGFEPGSERLAAGSEAALDGIAETLREYPVIDVAVEAHTDNQGSAESNLELSRRRALSVARYLAAQGVEPARLRPRAFGESRPRASNATPEGRARNRRVELAVIE